MPRYTKSFKRPEFHDEEIMDENGRLVGRIRIKPSSVMWKPNGSRAFLSVGLDKFTTWMVSKEAGAARVKG